MGESVEGFDSILEHRWCTVIGWNIRDWGLGWRRSTGHMRRCFWGRVGLKGLPVCTLFGCLSWVDAPELGRERVKRFCDFKEAAKYIQDAHSIS